MGTQSTALLGQERADALPIDRGRLRSSGRANAPVGKTANPDHAVVAGSQGTCSTLDIVP